MVLSIYFYIKLRERRLRHCTGTLKVSRETKTLIDHNDKTAVNQGATTKWQQ